MAAPIMVNDTAVGFLGVDNPRKNTNDLLLLSVAASTCYSEIATKRMMDSDREENSKKLMDRMKIIQSMSEIYTSAYYINLATGRFTELSSAAGVHTHIGASGDAQDRLAYFCHHMVEPAYKEDLLAFVDLSTLNERLKNTRIISKQYQSTLFSPPEGENTTSWRVCSFIECDRDPGGRLAHVIFTTQSIHDAKVRELEAQKKLQETNEELTALLAAEKQYTAIIGAMSNVYFALYYIIISAYDWSDIELEARVAGANAFISKPLFRSRLAKTFNALVGEEEKAEPAAPLVELGEMDLASCRALLVEDNELNAEIATELLEMTGITVECAADGTEAVDMVTECPDGYYDIIFMDIQMPRMNGYDAARAIRAMGRNYCKQVPIVAMTANAFAEDVLAAKTVGMNEHIAKPLDLNALTRTLNKWLR